jgi:hypothetical protein
VLFLIVQDHDIVTVKCRAAIQTVKSHNLNSKHFDIAVSYGEKLVCDRKKQEKVDKCSKFCRVIPFMGSIVDGVGNYSSLQHTTNDNSVTIGTKKMWSYETGDLSKEVQFIQNFLLLLEVTTWAGLTVSERLFHVYS